ncbi:hypothetical protein T08_1314 [Trichinella sp. T8]|nr:hypothetical protein T08_1314 [Trichinella sp. T8]
MLSGNQKYLFSEIFYQINMEQRSYDSKPFIFLRMNNGGRTQKVSIHQPSIALNVFCVIVLKSAIHAWQEQADFCQQCLIVMSFVV